MKKNIGLPDKLIRLAVAAIFAILYFTNTVQGIWGIVLLLLSGIFILTSLVSWCPLYFPFGISTIKTKSSKAGK